MGNFTINNHGIVNIYNGNENLGIAKDKLLTKLYYARNKPTMGGYEGWLKLLDMYYEGNYAGMKEFIRSCRGKGGKTRNECINYINIIIGGN